MNHYYRDISLDLLASASKIVSTSPEVRHNILPGDTIQCFDLRKNEFWVDVTEVEYDLVMGRVFVAEETGSLTVGMLVKFERGCAHHIIHLHDTWTSELPETTQAEGQTCRSPAQCDIAQFEYGVAPNWLSLGDTVIFNNKENCDIWMKVDAINETSVEGEVYENNSSQLDRIGTRIRIDVSQIKKRLSLNVTQHQ